MSLNFLDAVNTKTSDIERPPLQPVGTYKWAVEKVPSIETSKDQKWDYCNFQLKCLGAEDDVDSSALSAFGSLANIRQTMRFIFDKNDQQAFDRTMFRLRRFLEDHLKIDGAADNEVKVNLAKSVNHQCLGTIVWTLDKNDNETQFANIGKTAPLP